MLGLARRAAKTVIGTDMICRAMPRGEIALLVVSSGASEATRKKLANKCEFYGVLLIEVEMETEDLGRLLGKTYTPAAVAITDAGIAEQIKKAYDALNQ
jgi:ribosomal protein L7Ae-like RNA K-turn-binding protein